jgi:hypothetical protein
MRRTRHDIYAKARTLRYIVLWDIHWHVIECQRLEPGSDLRGAMAITSARLMADGWQIESDMAHGFVFVNRGGERRLLMLTERDPVSESRQSFDPFRMS